MTVTIRVLSPYTGDGLSPATAYQPLLCSLYSIAWTDVTGTPMESLIPDINLIAIEAVVTPERLAAIEADSRFVVLWSEVQ